MEPLDGGVAQLRQQVIIAILNQITVRLTEQDMVGAQQLSNILEVVQQ